MKDLFPKQWKFLKRAWEEDSLSHGYLFTGRSGLGKKKMAEFFTKWVMCESEGGAPCGKCKSCRMIEKKTHPDFFLLESEDGKSIKVDSVDDFLKKLSLKPSFGRIKVGVVHRAHLMNHYSQNAILKTLEEPKGDSVLFLTSSSSNSLLPTITSRLQELRFQVPEKKELARFLKKKGFKVKDEILTTAGLRPVKALRYLQNREEFEKEKERRQKVKELLKADLNKRFEIAKKLSKENPEEMLVSWLYFLRRVLFWKLEEEDETIPVEKTIKEMENTLYLLQNYNVNKKITLQDLMLKI